MYNIYNKRFAAKELNPKHTTTYNREEENMLV